MQPFSHKSLIYSQKFYETLSTPSQNPHLCNLKTQTYNNKNLVSSSQHILTALSISLPAGSKKKNDDKHSHILPSLSRAPAIGAKSDRFPVVYCQPHTPFLLRRHDPPSFIFRRLKRPPPDSGGERRLWKRRDEGERLRVRE
ncbi:hypothetical protein Hdeb2414_s0005g00153091 [Helianthus debilis subsp. tardiflorus]